MAGSLTYQQAGVDTRKAAALVGDIKSHIGSCTKSMTATLAAILIDEGRLKWKTRIPEVFPDLKVHPGYLNATIEHLLTNTAGVPGNIDSDLWTASWKRTGSDREQRLQLTKGLLAKPPAYRPGEDQVYSNAGFSIAGAMMEKIMDKPFERLLTERLFEPLEMTSAGFRAPASVGSIDQPYGHKRGLTGTKPINPEPKGDNPPAISPAGAVHCSVGDFAKYALFHLGKTSSGILPNESLAKLHKPVPNREYGYGWGMANPDWAGGQAITHSGSNTMFYAVIWIAPSRDFAALAMCNYGDREGFEKCDEAIGHLVKEHLR